MVSFLFSSWCSSDLHILMADGESREVWMGEANLMRQC